MQPEIVEYVVQERHLTTLQLPQFRKDLVTLARKGPRGVLLNLTRLESLDSATLGVIVLLARLLPSPARVCMFGARREIRTLCEVLRINAVIGIAETREEAVAEIHEYLARKMKLRQTVGSAS